MYITQLFIKGIWNPPVIIYCFRIKLYSFQRFESSTNVPAFLFEWCLKGVPDWRPQAFPLRETPVIARKRMDPDMLDWSETFSSSNLPVHNTHTIDRELRIMTWAYGVQLHSYSVDVKYSV